jgi:predicted HD superfamily hydrolase involved in NAD metabolism
MIFFVLLMDSKRIIDLLKKNMSSKRLAHCERVMETALKVAKTHGIDQKKVRQAALLHDVCREWKMEDLKKELPKTGIKLNADELECPGIWHAFVGALVAKNELSISDDEILDAIRWHSIGKADMGPVAKCVYLGDILEPEREGWNEHPETFKAISSATEKNIDTGMLLAVAHKIQLSIGYGTVIPVRSIELWNKLVTLGKSR